MSINDWFAYEVSIAHSRGKIPHGPALPEGMPWTGDMFVLENEDGSDTLYVWWGKDKWEKGPNLTRPK